MTYAIKSAEPHIIAMQDPTKYAFTKRRYVDRSYGGHWVEQYNIFDKPHGKKLFEITNSYGDFAIDDVFIDVNDPVYGNLYGKCAMAIHTMDAQIQAQEQALDDLIYNHNHEFNLTGNKYPFSNYTIDGIYRVWLNKKLQFIVNEQDAKVYFNRPKTITCRPFDMIIPKQTLINLINHQK
jgi:hypothetical protein